MVVLIAAVVGPFVGLALLLILARVETAMLGQRDVSAPSAVAEPDDGYAEPGPAVPVGDDAAA